VFVSTCVASEKLERMLSKLGESMCAIHGNKAQTERTQTIDAVRCGNKNILIATDVAARGIDIEDVKTIINYDVPETHKDYIHRVGRTARAGKTGRAISFVTQYDVEEFQRVEAKVGVKMTEYAVEGTAVQSVLDIVNDAKREADMEMKEQGIGQKIKDAKRKKNKQGKIKKRK